MSANPMSNTYDDDDLKAVVDEIEAFEAKKEEIMAAARGECAGIAKKIKDTKKRAKTELRIPGKPLSALLKTRKLERQIKEVADGVDEDEIEIFEDMTGQFSFLKPANDDQTPAQAAASQRREEVDEQEEREHEEGEKELNKLESLH
ncbi:hypothetical protein MXMO3_01784 [Maritalea myrionectae]|uniref:Uncharacterized protein n=1 Tax=Maritalea myrionectae TaxID=454601 RepID=A0A2R4MEM3_9HYPH|nr:hypothetical protein [Maritalea myrionectae]AVX04309.1 hypothetical protein MXMO3_01784 [Maritalea myrionectae]